MRPTVAGFLIGSFVPFAYGVQWMANDIAYHTEMSRLLPNVAACGTGTLGAFALIFIIAPVCGATGVVATLALSSILGLTQRK